MEQTNGPKQPENGPALFPPPEENKYYRSHNNVKISKSNIGIHQYYLFSHHSKCRS